jgi:PAS domain S-box-containing protein
VGRWFEVSAHPSTQGLSVFLHDITDRKSNEEALLLVTNRLKLATSAANIGIWDWDTVQNKLVWDDKMYDIYGVSPETFDKSYTTWFAMVHPEDQERVETNVATTFDGLSNYNAVFRIIRPDGSIRYIKATGLAQFDQDSRPIRMLGTNADVTPQIELQAKLEKALQDAKSANEAKSQFLAMMSHEIRTPMNAVVGFCDLLVQTALTEDQVDFVTSIQKAGASLTEIIDGILDFSKIEAGKLELRREPCNLRTLIDEVYDLLSPAAWLRGLSFRKNVDPNLPALMMGDPGAIKRVLTNLIGNAIKFTDVGQVIVDAGVQEDDGKQVVQIDVLDTGIGVSDEMQGQLFRPFSQGDRSNKRRFGGTGLGLAISRSLAEGMGGTLTMRSRQEGGSEFRFMFPVIPFDGGNDEPHVSSSETPDSASEIRLHNGPTVLLVEDNTVNRRLMGHFLKRLGCSFDAVEDGEQAVRALRDKQYAAVLMDIQMPVMDGWEATAAIRELEASNPDRPRSYIIAQSAHASGDDIRKCLAAGMDDYLSKPMTLSALSQALARAAASEAKR